MGFLNAFRIKAGGCFLAIVLLAGGLSPAAIADKGQPKMTKRAAAVEAKKLHGGQVLKVKLSRSGTSYQVKLLLDSGLVKFVEIKAR